MQYQQRVAPSLVSKGPAKGCECAFELGRVTARVLDAAIEGVLLSYPAASLSKIALEPPEDTLLVLYARTCVITSFLCTPHVHILSLPPLPCLSSLLTQPPGPVSPKVKASYYGRHTIVYASAVVASCPFPAHRVLPCASVPLTAP